MSNRQPFQMPTGCSPVTFSTHILPTGFSLCSLPTFTTPIAYLPGRPIPAAPVSPPLCPCIPTVRATHASVHMGGTAFNFDIKMVPADIDALAVRDCCNPTYQFEYTMNMPCIPFTMVKATTSMPDVTGQLVSGLLIPKVTLQFASSDDCIMKFKAAVISPKWADGLITIVTDVRMDGNNLVKTTRTLDIKNGCLSAATSDIITTVFETEECAT